MPEQLAGSLPRRSTAWWYQMTVVTGGARTMTIDAAQSFNHYTAQAGPANGDSATNMVYLMAGTYSFSIRGRTTTSLGIADWYLDGVRIVTGASGGTGDWYSGALTRNVLQTTAGIVIPTSGSHVLKSTINGKNAASSSFGLQLTHLWFFPATD